MGHPYDDLRLTELRRRRSMKWRQHPADVLPVQVAELDFPLAEPVRAALADLAERGDTGYSSGLELPEAYADFAAYRYGQAIDPASCHLVGDVMQGVYVALRLFTEPGAGIVICPPVYHPFFSTIEAAGRAVVPVPLAAGNDLDFAGLEAAFAQGASVFLLCTPHNPVGRVWSTEDLMSVAELAARYGVLVLADEIHAPLTYPGVRHTPFGSLDYHAVARSISFVSASKAWNLPGLKCALAVTGSAELGSRWARLPELVPVAASIFGVAASVAAFTEGRSWLDDTLGYLDGNRALLGRLLAERLPGVRWVPPEATYLAWLDCSSLGLGDDPGSVFLERGRVALDRGPRFGEPGAGFARFNFGTSRSLVTEAVDRMAAAL
ncbi:aminotransferase class I/II-fold pyridoxal phosphate-dependent enzyme [soil metagenome]